MVHLRAEKEEKQFTKTYSNYTFSMNYLHEDDDGQDLAATQLFNNLPRPYVLRRFPAWGGRRYFTSKEGKLWIGIGATTWKDLRVPPSRYLLEYFKEFGEDSDENSSNLADLGTFMHYLFGEMLTAWANKQPYKISQKKISDDLREFMMYHGMRMYDHSKYAQLVPRYCAAIYHWLHTWQVEVESIEYPVALWDMNVATCIDAVITCIAPSAEKNKDGSEKKISARKTSEPTPGERVRVLVNLKTRLKAQDSYRDDGFQCGVELAAFNEYLPSHPCEHAAILAPVYTPASGVSFKFIFYDFYKKKDMEHDLNYWKGMVEKDVPMMRFLYPELYYNATYDEGGDILLDFSAHDQELGKKSRGKSKAGGRSIHDWCMDFFNENHV